MGAEGGPGREYELGRFRLLPGAIPREARNMLHSKTLLVRFKPDTKKYHTIFCQFI